MTDNLITARGWRGWYLNPEVPYLVFLDGHPGYRIDFDRLLTARDVLFWITQINGKVWGGDAVVGLVEALEDLLDLQNTLTRGDLTLESVREQVAAFVKERG